MKIEIAEPNRMSQSGSSLLRLIQNHKTPVLDLLVRESIQNSLDAHKEDAHSVDVEFLTGKFSSKKLGAELEGIASSLKERYPNDECQYLAICDSNTVGLTGEIDVQKVRNNNYGNLLKLVYEICKPQEAEGAGGSWGLGKTVYFRIGIGLVIYYSRISEGDGKYSSRLAASLVENESSKNAMIPEYKSMTRRGIAWWGEPIRENTTVPVTDEEYISKFLDIFGIKPYTGEKTGTAIIIPYINSETLLANNKIDYDDAIDEHYSPYWYLSIEKYLRIAVQRWYAPRLCNPYYQHGAFLKVQINDDKISADSMEPVFKTVQALYNRANHVQEEDFLSINAVETAVENVTVRKYLDDKNAGNIACAKLKRDILGMNAPNNKPEPAAYFHCESQEKSVNRPLVFFVRKPGMIVSYEDVSAWTSGIPSTDKNEYIFGIFVLNSLNKFKVDNCPVDSLEEYVRKSELADHTSWNDWSDSHFNPRVISKIQKSVTKVLSEEYADDVIERKPKENSELGRYLGDLILPPDGFGNNANIEKPPLPQKQSSKKKFAFSVDVSNIIYCSNNMVVPMDLKTSANKVMSHTGFEIKIESEFGKIAISEWEEKLKLIAPFSIEKIKVDIDTIDGEKVQSLININSNTKNDSFKDIDFSLISTSKGTACGLNITSLEPHSVRLKIITTIKLAMKNVRPAFTFDKEEK